ncbi:hypothetical protein TNCT_207491 [Trichonephila clavata]|uniref:Uncharacterized protein n=1 Tax=Trichonephila clavata TaxID=2740835 RepID=A0A8X6FSG0_TRICU|nr:hypothetical protein TNCT_207491 [Trichonephila clavata]
MLSPGLQDNHRVNVRLIMDSANARVVLSTKIAKLDTSNSRYFRADDCYREDPDDVYRVVRRRFKEWKQFVLQHIHHKQQHSATDTVSIPIPNHVNI